MLEKMSKLYAIFLLLIFCSTGILSAGNIIGTVVDSDKQSLAGVSIRLLNVKDSTLVSGASTDYDGKFIITKVRKGGFILSYSMIGMGTVYKNIQLKSVDINYDAGVVAMSDNSVVLEETVVSGIKTAVTVKQDTIEYNAGSYHTQPNAVVEDLLKKLPGVEVDSEGQITSGGKTISKILVDGKEFFADDPKMATRNLPADMVQTVQVVDRKSDLARMTGVDDGEEETVINLTVKKNMQNGWFGTVQGGYGTDDRYAGAFNINHFINGNQFTILGGANNINELNFTDQGRGRFNRFGGSNGITSSQSLGFNFNVGKGEDLRFGGNILYTHREQNSREKSEQQYLFPDSTSYRYSRSIATDKGHNLRADFRLQWNIDEYNSIDFRPRFSFNSNTSNKVDTASVRAGDELFSLVNHNENYQHNKGTSYEFSGELIYNHKFKNHAGRSFSVQMRYSLSDTKETGTSWNDIKYLLSQDDSELLSQYLDNHRWNNTVEGRLTWTEPLGDAANGHFMNFAYRIKYNWSNSDKLTYDLPTDIWTALLLQSLSDLPDEAEFNETLSNSFRNEFFNQELQVGYKRVHKMYNLDAGIMFTPSMSKSEDLINSAQNIDERWVWNVSPYMRFRYKFDKKKSLSIDYRARTSQPSMTQLQPVADTSNPLSIVVGNPDLKPTFTQNVSVRFSDFNAEAQRSIMAMVRGSYALNSIISKTMFDSSMGGQTTTYTNVSGVWNMSAMFMLNQPIGKTHWRVLGNLFSNYNSTAGYNNGEFNRSGTFMLRPSVGVTFSSDYCQLTVRPEYGLQMTHNSLANQNDNTIHSYGGSFDGSVYLPFGIELSTDLRFSATSGYSDGFDSNQWLWNAQISYSTLSNKSLTFALKVYDLLQQKQNISRTVTANYIMDREYNDLTRYFMFTVSWKFNSFGSRENIPQVAGEEDRQPMPPGGRPFGGRPQGPPPMR